MRELADDFGLSDAELGSIIESLVTDGLVSRHESGTNNSTKSSKAAVSRHGIATRPSTVVRAVEPCIALPLLLAKRMNEPEVPKPSPAEIERFIAFHERLTERSADAGHQERADEWTVLAERLVSKVERQVVFLAPGYEDGAAEFSRPVAEMALCRGASVRSVWASSLFRDARAAEHAKWLDTQDATPRSSAVAPQRVVIVDEVAALVADRDGKARVVRGPELERLNAMARQLWERGVAARPAGRRLATRGPRTSRRPRSEVVLRLLAEGYTDDAIARQLGCSVRTVRNDVASAMSVLGARSRFQAGVRAMQVGLV
jgi:DNA-binding CsgD family transcriptional regulator